MVPDPWNKFKSTSKHVYVCVSGQQLISVRQKQRSHQSYIRLAQILSEERTHLSEWVALPSRQPAEGCCSLFTRQRSAIFNFFLAAHIRLAKTLFSNRGWLLRLRKITSNWNCTVGSSNKNCRCWWVARIYCFHFWPILCQRRSVVFHRQHPCWPRQFKAGPLTRGTRLTDKRVRTNVFVVHLCVLVKK